MAPLPHPAHRTGQADFPHPAFGQDVTLSRATPSAASEHLLELIGFPISRSFTTYCVCLELRSLPSTGVTRLPRYYEPLRHPRAPGLSLAGFRLIIADHALGLPVFRALSLCTCCRHYPGAASGRTASLTSPSRISLPRKGRRVGLRIVLFEACSAFTRVTACTLALSPIRDTLIEGFSHFVTSMTAPIASGWSGCRVGLAPTGKRRLVTAHARSGHFDSAASGNLMRKVAPRPAEFSAHSCPSWASTMVRAMDKPMPMPRGFVVKNRSNTSLSFSTGIPEPTSDTERSAELVSRAVDTVIRRSALGMPVIASMALTIRFRTTC